MRNRRFEFRGERQSGAEQLVDSSHLQIRHDAVTHYVASEWRAAKRQSGDFSRSARAAEPVISSDFPDIAHLDRKTANYRGLSARLCVVARIVCVCVCIFSLQNLYPTEIIQHQRRIFEGAE